MNYANPNCERALSYQWGGKGVTEGVRGCRYPSQWRLVKLYLFDYLNPRESEFCALLPWKKLKFSPPPTKNLRKVLYFTTMSCINEMFIDFHASSGITPIRGGQVTWPPDLSKKIPFHEWKPKISWFWLLKDIKCWLWPGLKIFQAAPIPNACGKGKIWTKWGHHLVLISDWLRACILFWNSSNVGQSILVWHCSSVHQRTYVTIPENALRTSVYNLFITGFNSNKFFIMLCDVTIEGKFQPTDWKTKQFQSWKWPIQIIATRSASH